MNAKHRFLKFLVAREEMRTNKECFGGPGPFSDDPILANHHFCNINREHDYVTKFIHENFRVPFASRGVNFMVRQMLYCRIFNEPKTLINVCPLEDSLLAIAALKRFRTTMGGKVMRGAYMMPPHGKGNKGLDIIDHWIVDVCDAVAQIDFTEASTLDQIARGLMMVCGIGPFVANQVCTDLRYVPWMLNGDDITDSWEDWTTFILCGPGTRRGMNRYFERDLVFPQSDIKFTEELLAIREIVQLDIPTVIAEYFMDPNNLANSFCEFDKYERATRQISEGKEITLRHYKKSTNNQPQQQLGLLD